MKDAAFTTTHRRRQKGKKKEFAEKKEEERETRARKFANVLGRESTRQISFRLFALSLLSLPKKFLTLISPFWTNRRPITRTVILLVLADQPRSPLSPFCTQHVALLFV